MVSTPPPPRRLRTGRGAALAIHVTVQVVPPDDPDRWMAEAIAFYHRLLERVLAGRHSV